MCEEWLGCEPWRLAGMEKNTPVLLALSGGADSRALLHVLCRMAKRDGFSLLLAHVNHGIRGEEALRDRDFCVSLAKECGCELRILDADVPALAKASGRGVEEEARDVRYRWFESLMRERNIPILATAHHADDQLETVLFRLSRGSRLHGLCGIAPVRPFGNGVLVRPFLSVSRTAILDFCRRNGLEYVTDSTNTDGAYARNRIRGDVTPVLDGLFPGVAERVSTMCDRLREDEAYLLMQARQWLNSVRCENGIPVKAVAGQPAPILRRALAILHREVTGAEAEELHVNALLLALQTDMPVRHTLPNGWIAVTERGILRLLPAASCGREPFCLPFLEGETVFPVSGIRAEVVTGESHTKVHNLYTGTYIILKGKSDIIKKGLYWRSRHEGDRILQNGMHRRLRKLYNAIGIPPRLREQLPLLCDEEGILWAPFVGCRDGLPQEGEETLVSLILPEDL